MLKQHYEQQLPFTAVNMAAATQEPAPQQPHPHPNPDIASLSMQQQQQQQQLQQLQQQPTNLAQHHHHHHPQHEQQQGTLVSNISPEAQLSSNGGMATHSNVLQASILLIYMNWIPLTMDTIERTTAKW